MLTLQCTIMSIAFKFVRKLKHSTARLFKEYFSNVQTIAKTHKKAQAMCKFQNYYHTSQINP